MLAQVPSTASDVALRGVPLNHDEHCSIHPTVNILFHDAKLQKWPEI